MNKRDLLKEEKRKRQKWKQRVRHNYYFISYPGIKSPESDYRLYKLIYFDRIIKIGYGEYKEKEKQDTRKKREKYGERQENLFYTEIKSSKDQSRIIQTDGSYKYKCSSIRKSNKKRCG